MSSDERQLAEDVKALGLDQQGYSELVQDAYDRITTREFDRLQMAVGELLEQGHRLDGRTLKSVHTIAAKAGMERLTLKAITTTTTDLGEFEAIISTSAIDSEKDIVEPAAMVSALQAWTLTGKVVPLHWNHSSDPEDIVGHVNPESVKAHGSEVVAAGHVDLDTDRGRQVWRLMKAGSVGFSFGYLVPDGGAKARPGGGRHIVQLDVFEITVTAGPMNAETRVLATKALDEHNAIREQARREMFELLTTAEPVATKSVQLPVQIASFEC